MLLQIFEKNPTTVKNFGIWLRYQSRTGYHNMYKEYRANTLCGAVSQLYIDLSGKHSARAETVQIVRTSVLKASDIKRQAVVAFHDRSVRFPNVDKRKRAPTKALRTTFKADRPTLI